VIRSIPADVWAAIASAIAILLFAVADAIPAIAAAAFLLLCAHLVVELLGGTDWFGS
jgi:hypothetical protein